MVHLGGAEAQAIDLDLGPRLNLDITPAVGLVEVEDVREGKLAQALDGVGHPRRSSDGQVTCALRGPAAGSAGKGVLQEEEGQPEEVVAMEVRQHDRVDPLHGSMRPFEAVDGGRRAVKQGAAIQQKAAVAACVAEGVARADEREIQLTAFAHFPLIPRADASGSTYHRGPNGLGEGGSQANAWG